jgi:ankyrin repeat protein
MKNLFLFALVVLSISFSFACKPMGENVTPDGAKQMLQLRGYDINATGFFKAIASDDVGAIRTFYQTQFDPNVMNEKGDTPLTFALANDIKTFKVLLEKVDVNLRDKQGNTAPYLALVKDKREQFDLLMAKNPDVKLTSKDDKTLLQLAASKEDEVLIRDLIARGADVNAVDKIEGSIPMIETCISRRPNMEIIKLFLDKGAKINQQGNNKATCLIYVASNGNAAAVEELLKLGADPKLKDKDGKTALDWAKYQKHDSVVAVLKGK